MRQHSGEFLEPVIDEKDQPGLCEDFPQDRQQFEQRRTIGFDGHLQTSQTGHVQHMPVMSIPSRVQVEQDMTAQMPHNGGTIFGSRLRALLLSAGKRDFARGLDCDDSGCSS